MNEQCFFGIDGGGTHSRLALTDCEGNVLARTQAGSTNIYSVSKEDVFTNLVQLLDSALETAELKKKDLSSGCIGSAGLGREGEREIFRGFFDKILEPGFPVKLCSDGEILLCGGLKNPEGYCLIAGTGSIALGRSRDNRLVRSGGHGYMLGDEGGACWTGKTAIARIIRSMESRDLKSDMLPAILESAGLSRADDLIQYVHHDADKAKIAALAPVVTSAARNKDPLALDILLTGAKELCLLVKSVLGQSPWIKNMELVMAGGVIEHDEIITGMLKEILNREIPELKITAPKGTALEGASMLAAACHPASCRTE